MLEYALAMFGNLSAAIYVAISICFAYFIVKLVKIYFAHQEYVKQISKLPGPKPDFFFGNIRQYPSDLSEEFLKYLRDQMVLRPKVSVRWLGPFVATVQVDHPDTAKLLLRGSEPKGQGLYNLIRPWLGDGLLISNGQKWVRSRRLLTPAFHFDILKQYLVIKNRAADTLIRKISRHSDKGGYFEMFSEVCLFSLDVILQSAFSYKSDCQTEGTSHPYIKAVYELGELASQRFFQFWLYNDFLYSLTPKGRKWKRLCDYVHNVAETIIAERKETLDKETKQGVVSKCKDFLGILLTARDEDGIGLSPLEIRNEVDTFLFEGHDTTTSGISWIMYSVAKHPDVQRKMQQEIDEILKGRDTDDILWDDLPKLHYTTLVIKESLRMNPPVTFLQRETTKPLTIEGCDIPIGTMVNIVVYDVLNNHTVWEKSQEFIPERFLQENMENRDPFSFVAFSAGPRNCIGQAFAMHEMKTVVAKLLHRFNFELDPNHKVERLLSVVLRSKTGIMVKATPR